MTGKSFSHAGGGHNKYFATLNRGCNKFPPFKREVQKILPCLEGGDGGHKEFRICNFPI